MTVSNLVPWLLIIPLTSAVLSVLLPRRWGATVAVAGLVTQLSVAVLLWKAVASHGASIYSVGGWGAPLGIDLYVDALAAMMAVTSAAVVLAVGFYAGVYLRAAEYAGHFWALLWFTLAALNGIWFAADIFNLYVGLELLSLASVGLIALGGKGAALAAALRYLLMALLGSLLYLLGVGLLYAATGTLALQALAESVQPGPTLFAAFALMTVGLAFKGALWPLHAWLPPAHGGALTPVSAMLSALVIKAPFYIVLRLWLELGPEVLTPSAAQCLGVLGAGAIFWGGLLALRQVYLKMVVAYSTVAQIGYLFLAFPLMTVASAEAAALAWKGVLVQVAAHALAKAALFMAAGNLILAAGHDRVKELIGIGRHSPLSLLSFALAGMTLMGLPPSGGFIAKWLMLESALMTGQWWWAVVLVAGGLLTAAYIFRVLRQPFLASMEERAVDKPSALLEAAPLALAIASVALGLSASGPLAALQTELPNQGGTP